MTVRLRPLLAALAIALLAVAMTLNWGFYSPTALCLAVAAMITACMACSLPERREGVPWTPASPAFGDWLLALLAVGLSGYGTFTADVFARDTVAQAEAMLPWLARLGFVVTASLLLHLAAPSGRWRRLLPVQVLLLFLVGAQLRVSAVLAVPDPHIDVYNAFRDGTAHLLAGRNPYTGAYEHPYAAPPADYDRYPFYPPLPLLLTLPFRAAGLDVRFANVVCDLLAAWVLLAIGGSRHRPVRGALAAGAYLLFPRVPFMLEQAWYEPMLAATLGSGLLLVEQGRRLGYLLLGLGFTGKQYGPVLLVPLAWALRRHWQPLLLGIVVAGAVVVLPFLLWNPAAFLDVTFFAFLRRPPREISLTIQVGATELFDLVLPNLLLWAVAAMVIAWITWRTPLCRTDFQSVQPRGQIENLSYKAQGVTATALWMATALLTFCLLHKQGFFNYFYLCEYLFLLGFVGMTHETPVTKE